MKRAIAVAVLALSIACDGKGPTTPTPSPTPSTPAPAPAPAPAPSIQRFALSGQVTETAPTTDVGLGGATVAILDGANAGVSTPTDGNGFFNLQELVTGAFTVRVTRGGYDSADTAVSLTQARTIMVRLRPVLVALDETFAGDVSGGSPKCPDFFTTSSQPCQAFRVPIHHTGRITAVLTYTRPSSFGGNDLDLALLIEPRTGSSDRLAISRAFSDNGREEVTSDVQAGQLYWVHVLYSSGATIQPFTLRITRPN